MAGFNYIKACSAKQQDLVMSVERVVKDRFPICSTLSAPKEGGFVVTRDMGPWVVEVVFHPDGRETISYTCKTGNEAFCKSESNRPLGSVNPQQLAKARALILGAKK